MICYLPIHSLAHSGRTDGNGGHYDRSTGKYHYHHGYSAHDHWDMDGDGVIDCPYNYNDKTNHNYNNGSTTQTKPSYNTTHQDKGNDKTYAYIAIVFVVVFFVLVNCLAIHLDKTDKSTKEEPTSLLSVFISILSTVVVFALLFCIVCIYKDPLILKAISFGEMLEALFFSALLGGIVWFVANSASALVNGLLCTLFKVEVHGDDGCYQRLIIPLSYAVTVLLFILE